MEWTLGVAGHQLEYRSNTSEDADAGSQQQQKRSKTKALIALYYQVCF